MQDSITVSRFAIQSSFDAQCIAKDKHIQKTNFLLMKLNRKGQRTTLINQTVKLQLLRFSTNPY